MTTTTLSKKLIVPLSILSTGYFFYNPLMERLAHTLSEHNQNYIYNKMPKRIFLIRHGESMGNLNRHLYEKIPDNRILLTENGKKQAKELGVKLKQIIQNESIKFYVSPYTRTRQTYYYILESFKENKKKTFYDYRLREQEFGNLHLYDIPNHLKRIWVGRFYYRFNNGENGADVIERLNSFYNDLIKNTEFDKEKYDNYVFVIHSVVMRLMLKFLTNMTIEDYQQLKNPLNCGFWILEKDFKNRKYNLKKDNMYFH